jgi:serine/threonine-protein kinase HipA
LSGFPSTHILKPDLPERPYAALATNEYFCMRLAARCGLDVAAVELLTVGERPCVAVERFDRDMTGWPPRRLHVPFHRRQRRRSR